MRSIAIVLCLLTATSGSPAFADGIRDARRPESESPSRGRRARVTDIDRVLRLAQTPADPASQTGDVEARIADLETRLGTISTRGPRAATIAGGVMTGVGAGVAVAAGVICAAASAGSSTECRVGNAVGLAAGGAVLAIAGVVTLVTGRSKLRKRTQEREVIQREIDSLKRPDISRAMPSIGFGMGQGAQPGVVLGWRY